MQDPICAMKILRRPKCRVPNRNLVRPELRAAWQHECGNVAYSIDSQFASDPAVSSPCTAGPLVKMPSAEREPGRTMNERVSTYVYYNGQAGGDNYDSHNVSGALRISF
jgi:hypothetical protein